MSEIGALIIKLQAETAQFRQDMGKVKQDLDDLGGKGKKLDGSFEMAEAKGSMMLFEESVGVRLPRHLNALIAQIPGIGMAFQLMLPVAGVVAAIDIITKLIEKHDEAKRKALEQKEAWAALSEKIRTGADELQVANDKLRDAIAVFDGKPKNNVKLALDE